MVEVDQVFNTVGGPQITITKVGPRFIRAKVFNKSGLSLDVVKYLKVPIDGYYRPVDHGLGYEFCEGLEVEPEPIDDWGPWVETTDAYEMMAKTGEVMSEIRYAANGHVMAYRVKKG